MLLKFVYLRFLFVLLSKNWYVLTQWLLFQFVIFEELARIDCACYD